MTTKAAPGEHKATATAKILRDTPAHNLDAEKIVIGSMALKESSRDHAVAKLSPPDFYSQPHREIFSAIAELHSKGAAVDMVAIADALRKTGKLEACGGPAYLGELLNSVASATASRSSVRIVLECAHRRRLADAGLKLIDCAYDLGTDPVEASASVQALLDTASGQREESTSQAPSEFLNDYMAGLERLQAGKGVVGIPTPFDSLNYYISGLTPGEVIILAGRAGTGKTALALNIAWFAAAQGYPVGIVSMEMIKFALTNRLFAANAMIDAQKFRTGRFTAEDWDSLYAFANTLNEAPLKICDKSFLRPSELRAICRDWKKNFGLSLLVIDYLQLLQPETRSNNREREVADISRMIKIIAVELEIPIIVLAQLNREAEKEKHPKLTHLRESGCMTGDTRILRSDTGVPTSFSDLMKNDHKGVSVWALDADRRLVSSPVVNVFYSGEKETFSLETRSGRTVKASGNHKFLTFAGWKRLDELKSGDRIAIPRYVPEPLLSGLGWSEHKIGILAHMIGDGCLVKGQPVHYTSQDDENLRFVEDAARIEFGITPKRVKQGNWQHAYLPAPHHCTHGKRNPLSLWFDELGIGGLRSYEKHVPDLIFQASKDELSIFIRHLWATDGRVAEPSSMSSAIASISYSSTSKRLAEDVTTLLGRFGIVARIKTVKESKSKRPGHRVIVSDAKSLRLFCQEIGCHGLRGARARKLFDEILHKTTNTNVDSLPTEVWGLVKEDRISAGITEREFQKLINTQYCGSSLYKSGISRERLMRCAEALGSDRLKMIAEDDVFWDKIKSVESTGVNPVYDATVSGTHNFIADGIVAHNSLEQDADIVLFITPWKNSDAMEDHVTVTMDVAKGRSNAVGKFDLLYRRKFLRFENLNRVDG